MPEYLEFLDIADRRTMIHWYNVDTVIDNGDYVTIYCDGAVHMTRESYDSIQDRLATARQEALEERIYGSDIEEVD